MDLLASSSTPICIHILVNFDCSDDTTFPPLPVSFPVATQQHCFGELCHFDSVIPFLQFPLFSTQLRVFPYIFKGLCSSPCKYIHSCIPLLSSLHCHVSLCTSNKPPSSHLTIFPPSLSPVATNHNKVYINVYR